MWLAAISNLVQTEMPLHTFRFPRCDSIISRRRGLQSHRPVSPREPVPLEQVS